MTADRSVLVRLRADISQYLRQMTTAAAATGGFVKQLDTADSRMANLVQTGLALAPALVPIGATVVPVLTTLTTQLGFAAAGAGIAVTAFSGVGDTLEALREYELEPTEDKFHELQAAMSQLPVSSREFVTFLDGEVLPVLDRLQDAAADGVLPGVTEGIESLLAKTPQVRRVITELAEAGGQIAAESGADLAGEDWAEFLNYLESDAKPTLMEFARTVGNLAEGVATMLIGLDPLTDDLSEGLLDLTKRFADLDPSDYAEFVDYIREVGPDVLDTLGALGGALGAIVQAAAPVGAVALPVIEELAEMVAAVADSPAGPVLIGLAAGLSAVSRSVALYNAANGSALAGLLGLGGKEGAKAGAGFRTAAAGLSVLALSVTDLDDSLGVSNAAMGAMLGLLVGPWGAAVGGAAGLFMDLKSAGDDAEATLRAVNDALASGDMGSIAAAAENARTKLKDAYSNDGGIDLFGDAIDFVGRGGLDSLLKSGSLSDPAGMFAGVLADDPLVEAANRAAEGMETQQRAADDAATMVRRLEVAERELTDGLEQQSDAYWANVDAMRVKREEALRGINAELDYAQALLDSKEAAKDFRGVLRGLKDVGDASTEGQIEAVRVLNNEAAAWNNLNDKAKNAPGAFKAAKQALRETAEQMGLSKDAARAYVQQVLEIPPKRHTQVTADTSQALTALQRLQEYRLSPKVLRVVPDFGSFSDAKASAMVGQEAPFAGAGADGMTVPGQRHPYRDKVLIAAAPGEEIITNRRGEADRFRADRAAGRIPAYADGGTVTTSARPSLMSSSSQHVKVSGTATATLRTPWGDQQIEMRLREIAREEADANRRFDEVNA